MPFENLQIAVPCGYEDYLVALYGDYKKFVKFQSSHGYPLYKSMEADMRRRLAESGYKGTLEEYCAQRASGEPLN